MNFVNKNFKIKLIKTNKINKKISSKIKIIKNA